MFTRTPKCNYFYTCANMRFCYIKCVCGCTQLHIHTYVFIDVDAYQCVQIDLTHCNAFLHLLHMLLNFQANVFTSFSFGSTVFCLVFAVITVTWQTNTQQPSKVKNTNIFEAYEQLDIFDNSTRILVIETKL